MVWPRRWDFPEFFASQYPELCRLGYWLTGDWGQAEDLAQDALARVYWRWPLARRLDRPDQYTRKVLVNRYRSLLRRALVEARHAGLDDCFRLGGWDLNGRR